MRDSKNPVLSEQQALRIEVEVGQRAAFGGAFIFTAYLVFRFLTPFPSQPPAIINILGFGIGFVAVARIALATIQRKKGSDKNWRTVWRPMWRAVSLILALCWGLLSVATLQIYGISTPFFVVMITNCGIAAIAVHNLGLDLWLVRIYLPLMVGLPMLALVFSPDRGHRALAGVLFLFFTYLILLTRRAHELIWEALGSRALLQAQHDQLTAVLDAIPGYVFWTDETGKILGCNRKLAEELKESSSFIGKQVKSPDDFDKFLHSSEEEKLTETRFEFPKGKRWALVAMKKYSGGTATHTVVIAIDIEAEKQAEAELMDARARAVESARLAAMGTMASGIAHEINNPLQVVRALAHLLERPPANPIDSRQIGERIDKTTQQIARIIAGLRAFARVGTEDPFEIVNVKGLLTEVVNLVKVSRSTKDVSIEVSDIPGTLALECRRTEIGQVLINLINNSLEAVESLPERWVRISVLDLGSQVEIRVTDSGRGIPKELLDKISLPFFTTKVGTHGTGLGLSVSSSIVKGHKGRLWVDETQANTSFVVSLPKRQQEIFRNREAMWKTPS